MNEKNPIKQFNQIMLNFLELLKSELDNYFQEKNSNEHFEYKIIKLDFESGKKVILENLNTEKPNDDYLNYYWVQLRDKQNNKKMKICLFYKEFDKTNASLHILPGIIQIWIYNENDKDKCNPIDTESLRIENVGVRTITFKEYGWTPIAFRYKFGEVKKYRNYMFIDGTNSDNYDCFKSDNNCVLGIIIDTIANEIGLIKEDLIQFQNKKTDSVYADALYGKFIEKRKESMNTVLEQLRVEDNKFIIKGIHNGRGKNKLISYINSDNDKYYVSFQKIKLIKNIGYFSKFNYTAYQKFKNIQWELGFNDSHNIVGNVLK